jgi:hypothetical protein
MTNPPKQTEQELQGFLPAYQQATEFQSGEDQGQSGGSARTKPATKIIDFAVAKQLRRRKIYGWIFVADSNTSDYFVLAQVNFSKNNTNVGKLPLAIGNQTATSSLLQTSFVTVFITGGNSVQDCIGLYVTNPVNGQPSSVVLQPLYIYGEFDEISVDILQTRNITDCRIFLACLSSQ